MKAYTDSRGILTTKALIKTQRTSTDLNKEEI